jgi:hypothetical protein
MQGVRLCTAILAYILLRKDFQIGFPACSVTKFPATYQYETFTYMSELIVNLFPKFHYKPFDIWDIPGSYIDQYEDGSLLIQEEEWEKLTIPLPLVASEETSAITAIERLTLPLLIPPITLANTKSAKFLDNAQRT